MNQMEYTAFCNPLYGTIPSQAEERPAGVASYSVHLGVPQNNHHVMDVDSLFIQTASVCPFTVATL